MSVLNPLQGVVPGYPHFTEDIGGRVTDKDTKLERSRAQGWYVLAVSLSVCSKEGERELPDI